VTTALPRFVLFLAAALVPSVAAAAPASVKDALAEYVAAGKSLVAVLDGIKDLNTAKAAQPNLSAAIDRFNAAKSNLQKLSLDQANKEHQDAMKTMMGDVASVSSQLSAQTQRIQKLPQVMKLLQDTLAKLS
jgi:hypothetical protein